MVRIRLPPAESLRTIRDSQPRTIPANPYDALALWGLGRVDEARPACRTRHHRLRVGSPCSDNGSCAHVCGVTGACSVLDSPAPSDHFAQPCRNVTQPAHQAGRSYRDTISANAWLQVATASGLWRDRVASRPAFGSRVMFGSCPVSKRLWLKPKRARARPLPGSGAACPSLCLNSSGRTVMLRAWRSGVGSWVQSGNSRTRHRSGRCTDRDDDAVLTFPCKGRRRCGTRFPDLRRAGRLPRSARRRLGQRGILAACYRPEGLRGLSSRTGVVAW